MNVLKTFTSLCLTELIIKPKHGIPDLMFMLPSGREIYCQTETVLCTKMVKLNVMWCFKHKIPSVFLTCKHFTCAASVLSKIKNCLDGTENTRGQ